MADKFQTGGEHPPADAPTGTIIAIDLQEASLTAFESDALGIQNLPPICEPDPKLKGYPAKRY